jgi:uncharacterized protein YbjT (DUF2867 family)
MSKVILVTGATGKQGGAVVDALVKDSTHNISSILAVTRDPNSSSSKKLASKSVLIKLVQGNLDDVPTIFKKASSIIKEQIWGVYSVQVSQGKGVTVEGEIAQGKALIDESVKRGVKYFVYSSVDRGGDDKSWVTKTPIPHFQTKYEIEHYLRDKCGKMEWTILRPVAFMDVGSESPQNIWLKLTSSDRISSPVSQPESSWPRWLTISIESPYNGLRQRMLVSLLLWLLQIQMNTTKKQLVLLAMS